MESRMTRLQLWAVHPDIVSVLCKICPALLEDLLDGDADPRRINLRDSSFFKIRDTAEACASDGDLIRGVRRWAR